MARRVRHAASGSQTNRWLAVAEQRFEDAVALSRTGENARANGTRYLAGIVIDILLKAQIANSHPTIARKRSHEVTTEERETWSLIWRSHDLDDMIGHQPDL